MTDAAKNEVVAGNRNSDAAFGSDTRVFYHGTRDDFRPGDIVPPGDPSGNSSDGEGASFTYVSPDLDAAIWSAELAMGKGPPRVYVVESDDDIEDASDLLTDIAPRHPYMSWRTNGEVAVKSEVTEWTWYHGTRAKLSRGDMLVPGSDPNYGQTLSHVYLTRTLDAAIWAAELALGEGPQRIYIVEPTGPVEDDPNVTDKRFGGNPTKSFRSRDPVRVLGEITQWKNHSEEAIATMKAGVEKLSQQGLGPIDD